MLRHVGSLPQPAVPAYTELDARIAWQPRPQRGTVADRPEPAAPLAMPSSAPPARASVFERAVLVKLAMRF